MNIQLVCTTIANRKQQRSSLAKNAYFKAQHDWPHWSEAFNNSHILTKVRRYLLTPKPMIYATVSHWQPSIQW